MALFLLKRVWESYFVVLQHIDLSVAYLPLCVVYFVVCMHILHIVDLVQAVMHCPLGLVGTAKAGPVI
jgi:hypothetical protein